MKLVTLVPKVDDQLCTGCHICQRVCPTLSIEIPESVAVVDEATCAGCGACEQRCPEHAIEMVLRPQPRTLKVDVESVDYGRIREICRKARFHPEQVVCFCTGTRAEEVAAAILNGARSPEDISRSVGARTGCKVECIEPLLRLLHAAGISPARPKGGYQWYGLTPTVWEVPEPVKQRYSDRGFRFDDDARLMDKVASAKGGA